jgi:hypothetical protein
LSFALDGSPAWGKKNGAMKNGESLRRGELPLKDLVAKI